ncbi:MAG TPA: hypothetical protein VLB51_06150 [Methylomirabilota bacterium]|nr:hypothetical protein [Methylomirabilota bacterium]
MAEPPLVTSPGSHPNASAATSLPALALAVGLGLALLGGQAGQGFGPVGSLLAVGLWLAPWTLATVGAGRPLIRRLRGDDAESPEDLVLAAALGATALRAAAAALSVVGWFRPWPLLALLIGLAVYRLDPGCASTGAGDLASW